MTHNRTISIIGLGYVGLSVAVTFGKRSWIIGFDIDVGRIEELHRGVDRTREVDPADLIAADIHFTHDAADLRNANFHIVIVPTPIDDDTKQPNLQPLLDASHTVGRHLKLGDIVVFESTVYPGATEEQCVPALEAASGLVCGTDFTVGYAPERINPGDKEHTFEQVVKVVAGQNEATLETIASVYGSVTTGGIHRAATIKVAEAAKVIENTQRDINIALMNEFALICNKIGIDTEDVLKAAGTKWNFHPFTPGLVGGHCIGVDPYYLAYKAEAVGHSPHVILAGRRVNDGIGAYVAEQTVDALARRNSDINGTVVTILGITFKENITDIRNTRVLDIVHELKNHELTIQIHDPYADPDEVRRQYGFDLMTSAALLPADAVVLAIAHTQFVEAGWRWITALMRDASGIVFDVKSVLDPTSCPKTIDLRRL